jgi:hypothetical protein
LFVGSESIYFDGSSVKSRCLLKWRRPHILYTDPAPSLKEQLRSRDATARQRVTSLRGRNSSETSTNVFTSQFIRRHLYTNESLLSVAPQLVGSHWREKVAGKAANANFPRSGMGLAHWARRGMKKTVSERRVMQPEVNWWSSRMPISATDRIAASARMDLTKVTRNVNGFPALDRQLSSLIRL